MGWVNIDHETGVFQHREYIGSEWVWNRPLKNAERGNYPDLQIYTIWGNSNYTKEYTFTKIKLAITEGSGGSPLNFNYIKFGHAESLSICDPTLTQQIDGTSYEITWDLTEAFQTVWLQDCAPYYGQYPYNENYSRSIYIEFQTANQYNPVKILSIQGWVDENMGLYKTDGRDWKITKKRLPRPPMPPQPEDEQDDFHPTPYKPPIKFKKGKKTPEPDRPVKNKLFLVAVPCSHYLYGGQIMSVWLAIGNSFAQHLVKEVIPCP